MPWMETQAMDQRMRLIVAHEQGEASMAELCRQFGISRKTAYKWRARYQADDVSSLVDRQRAPRHHPNAVSDAQRDALLAARDDHCLWGPRKLLKLLDQGHPEDWPAPSTVALLLKRHGRVQPRKRRRRVPPQSQPLAHAGLANAVWCCDFKGWFCTGDGQKCSPLTITDAYSRYLLRCQGLLQTDVAAVQPIFELAFREYGLPQAIRSDNGPPFASRAVGGLSRLSIWWLKLGIRPERIAPGHPEQNGRHERMHRTLQEATAAPPASTFGRQQQRMDAFRQEYNELRPHEALDMATPASRYEPSPRPFPARVPELEYASGWQRRRVDHGGYFSWKHQMVFLSEVLHGETVGLEPVDERYWRAYFGPVFLGVLDAHRPRMLEPAAVRRLDRQRARAGLAAASPLPAAAPSAALREPPPAAEKVSPMCLD